MIEGHKHRDLPLTGDGRGQVGGRATRFEALEPIRQGVRLRRFRQRDNQRRLSASPYSIRANSARPLSSK